MWNFAVATNELLSPGRSPPPPTGQRSAGSSWVLATTLMRRLGCALLPTAFIFAAAAAAHPLLATLGR